MVAAPVVLSEDKLGKILAKMETSLTDRGHSALSIEATRLKSSSPTQQQVEKFLRIVTVKLLRDGVGELEVKGMLTQAVGKSSAAGQIIAQVCAEAQKELRGLGTPEKTTGGLPDVHEAIEETMQQTAGAYNPEERFGEWQEPANVGVITATPAMFEFVKAQVAEKMGIVFGEEGRINRDATIERGTSEEAIQLFESVFANENEYMKFISAEDKQKYLFDILYRVLGASASDGSALTLTVSGTTVKANTPINQFIIAFNSITFSTGSLYDGIMGEESKLSEREKEVFRRQFFTLYDSDAELGNGYLLAVYLAVKQMEETGKFKNFQKWYARQLGMMRNLWGPSIADAVRLDKKTITDNSELERYMMLTYQNFCLGAIVAGASDKPIRATFFRAFTVGLLGVVSGLADQVIGQNLGRLSQMLTDEAATQRKKDLVKAYENLIREYDALAETDTQTYQVPKQTQIQYYYDRAEYFDKIAAAIEAGEVEGTPADALSYRSQAQAAREEAAKLSETPEVAGSASANMVSDYEAMAQDVRIDEGTRQRYGQTAERVRAEAWSAMGARERAQYYRDEIARLERELIEPEYREPQALEFTRPVSALLSFVAGVGSGLIDLTERTFQQTIFYPFVVYWQTFCMSVGANVGKDLLDARDIDEDRMLYDPYLATAVFGVLAAYGSHMSGARGLTQPTMQQVAQGLAGPIEAAQITAARDVIDSNVITVFEEGVDRIVAVAADETETDRGKRLARVALALDTITHAVNTYPTQEDEIKGGDIDSVQVIDHFTDSGEQAVKLYGVIREIYANVDAHLNDLMELYDGEWYELTLSPQEGLDVLQKYLDSKRPEAISE